MNDERLNRYVEMLEAKLVGIEAEVVELREQNARLKAKAKAPRVPKGTNEGVAAAASEALTQ